MSARMRRRSGADLTAVDIEALLAKRYPAPAFAFLPQLRNSTGWSNNVRTADAVALSTWPSRGLDLTGFEIKVRRGDWMSELANPAKADEIQRYCDFWYIVAPPHAVEIGEVPPTWGFIAVDGKQLRTVREAPRLADPLPLDRLLVCAILRNVNKGIEVLGEGFVKAAEVDEIVEERIRREIVSRANRDFEKAYDDLKARVDAFEKASGLEIEKGYQGAENIGEAAQALMRVDFNQTIRERLDYQIRSLEDALVNIKKADQLLANAPCVKQGEAAEAST